MFGRQLNRRLSFNIPEEDYVFLVMSDPSATVLDVLYVNLEYIQIR